MKITTLGKRNAYWDKRFEQGQIYGSKSSKISDFYLEHLIGKSAFEFACGYGKDSAYLAKNGVDKIIAMDVSEKAITLAIHINNIKSVQFMVGDVTRLKFKNGSFEAIYSVYGMDIFTSKELHTIFSSLHNLLMPRGTICTNYLTANDAEYGIGYKSAAICSCQTDPS